MNQLLPKGFSIIIPYHSGARYTRQALENLIHSVRDSDQIIFFINNSDRSAHDIGWFSDRIEYIHVYENLGYGQAVNSAVTYAMHEWLVFCDQDIITQPGWLESLWTTYCTVPDIGMVGAKLLDHRTHSILDFGIASSGYNFIHSYLGLPADHPATLADREVQMVCSALCMVSKTDFNTIGGFYEPFGTLYTDLDFCLRLKDIGKKVWVSAAAVAYHFCGEYYPQDRNYKSHYLKADVKGVFMMRNAERIVNDMENILKHSYETFIAGHRRKESRYLICNIMSVANPADYEEILLACGMRRYDVYRKPVSQRDSAHIDLFEVLGSQIMHQKIPVAYFIDRFIGIRDNYYWMDNRKGCGDIVVDRHANILTVNEVLYGMGK